MERRERARAISFLHAVQQSVALWQSRPRTLSVLPLNSVSLRIMAMAIESALAN